MSSYKNQALGDDPEGHAASKLLYMLYMQYMLYIAIHKILLLKLKPEKATHNFV